MRADRCAVATATMLPVSVATLTLALANTAGAAPPPITWGSATNISGNSDVSTSGTLMYAYNIGGAGVSSATVNTVTFASYAFPAFGAGADRMTTSRRPRTRSAISAPRASA